MIAWKILAVTPAQPYSDTCQDQGGWQQNEIAKTYHQYFTVIQLELCIRGFFGFNGDKVIIASQPVEYIQSE